MNLPMHAAVSTPGRRHSAVNLPLVRIEQPQRASHHTSERESQLRSAAHVSQAELQSPAMFSLRVAAASSSSWV